MPKETGLLSGLTDPATGRTRSSTMVPRVSNGMRNNPEDQTTFLVAAKARYFKDRLVFGIGHRWDSLDVSTYGTQRNPQTQLWEVDYNNLAPSSYEGLSPM